MTSTNYETFILSIEGPLAEIELNQPKKINALSTSFWSDFPLALQTVEDSASVRVLLLHASGKNFCAGMDLDFFKEVWAREKEEPARFREWIRRQILNLQEAITALEQLRVPVIGVTQGACLGAGLDLICAANLRLSTEDAYFAIHEINVGMTADLGVLQRLPKLMSPALVDKMAYTGCKLGACEARQAGFLLDVCADKDSAMQQARELATAIAEKSPLAIAGSKVALRYSRDHSVADALTQIADWNAGMFLSEDLKLGIEAQAQGKLAVYKDIVK